MLNIETKELIISDKLKKKKIKMIWNSKKCVIIFSQRGGFYEKRTY